MFLILILILILLLFLLLLLLLFLFLGLQLKTQRSCEGSSIGVSGCITWMIIVMIVLVRHNKSSDVPRSKQKPLCISNEVIVRARKAFFVKQTSTIHSAFSAKPDTKDAIQD
ncbi:hypothetical protein CU102_02530 [Phyllobacterium brassicacearum]|uniref:Uncharacterized protein n=1 Tax=Phyllobacterium brassicacearum TaxID=314235 RepID=A0A2P7BWV2_9HYPH|nr:hypothetical protein CU102_02530 [Phyllobacterium brassicacearum]